MRGQQERSGSLFSYVSIEERIPAHHPLRRVRHLAYQALDRLNPTFCQLYASEGRHGCGMNGRLRRGVARWGRSAPEQGEKGRRTAPLST